MATKPTAKVQDLVIPAVSGWTPWLELDDHLPVAIETPDAWTPAAIAVKARMRGSGSGGTVYDDDPGSSGTQITIAAAADRFIRLDERLFLGAVSLAFAADGQAAARTISVALIPVRLVLGAAR